MNLNDMLLLIAHSLGPSSASICLSYRRRLEKKIWCRLSDNKVEGWDSHEEVGGKAGSTLRSSQEDRRIS